MSMDSWISEGQKEILVDFTYSIHHEDEEKLLKIIKDLEAKSLVYTDDEVKQNAFSQILRLGNPKLANEIFDKLEEALARKIISAKDIFSQDLTEKFKGATALDHAIDNGMVDIALKLVKIAEPKHLKSQVNTLGNLYDANYMRAFSKAYNVAIGSEYLLREGQAKYVELAVEIIKKMPVDDKQDVKNLRRGLKDVRNLNKLIKAKNKTTQSPENKFKDFDDIKKAMQGRIKEADESLALGSEQKNVPKREAKPRKRGS